MVSQREAHESVQIRLLICLPLLLLLIAFVVVSVRASRTIAKFPTFSVRIWPIREGPSLLHYLDYRETKRLVEFQVLPSPTWGSLLAWLKNARGETVLVAPRKLTDDEVQSLTPSLRLGLAKLGFDEYRIHGESDNQILSAGKTKELQNAS